MGSTDILTETTGTTPLIATLIIEDPESEDGATEGGSAGEPAKEPEGPGSEPGKETASVPVKRRETVHLYEGQSFRIGRATANNYSIKNRNVSRFHAVFSASSSGVVLSDLSSLNGTLVNGNRISTAVDLSSGDVVTISDTKIAVKLSLGEGDHNDSTHGRTQTAQLAAVVVTVLVVDVCGYTKISEALPPKDVAHLMHIWFQNMSEIVKNGAGEVDKYIGDCVMALWRGTHGDAPVRAKQAVTAGIEMLKETARISTSGEWPYHQSFPIRCRVALNTGEALMGTVGGAGKRDFTVLGDTVNVAFRLEGIAGKLDTFFLCSAATADLVKDVYEVKDLGKVNVEGRSGEIKVFTLADGIL